MERTQEQRKKELIQALTVASKKALGRGEDKGITNTVLNQILKAHKEIGLNKVSEIVENLKTVKPAKSIDDLVYNITHKLVSGTRSDRSVLDVSEFEF